VTIVATIPTSESIEYPYLLFDFIIYLTIVATRSHAAHALPTHVLPMLPRQATTPTPISAKSEATAQLFTTNMFPCFL
jgi:hypothetical protein